MIIEEFNHSIDIWIKELEQYDFNQSCVKPSPDSWSLGQVCMHLINESNYYLEQIKFCLSNNDNVNEDLSSHAKTMFRVL